MSNSEEGTRPDRAARRKPLEDAPKQGGGLSSLFGGGRLQNYTSVLKSLEQIGLEPKTMLLNIGDQTVDCIVIPIQDLVFKEWQYMSGSGYKIIQPQNEGTND